MKLKTDKKYNIIYADPPWPYDNEKGNDPKMGGFTYPSMDLEDIKNLPINEISNKNSVLFLWATMPKLIEAFEVIESWGFKYTTCAFVWVKLNKKSKFDTKRYNDKRYDIIEGGIYSGLGHWTNGNVELCLFAKKGSLPRQQKNVKQLIFSPLGRHSAKPQEVKKRITDLMGDIPRIELFARDLTYGWDAWGNEINSDIVLSKNDIPDNTISNDVLSSYSLDKFI